MRIDFFVLLNFIVFYFFFINHISIAPSSRNFRGVGHVRVDNLPRSLTICVSAVFAVLGVRPSVRPSVCHVRVLHTTLCHQIGSTETERDKKKRN